MSRKIERLINLTIALLATKRYLSKSEIFNSVEGYEGSAETKERMFERDKDDLRTLGIEIEVGSFDPLFNDDPGYRIKSEKYELDFGDITPIEVSLLSLAAKAWEGAALDDAAQRALLKLNSMGISADVLELPAIAPKLSNSSQEISAITKAIADSDFLIFDYLNSDLSQSERTVIPFSLVARSGYWYLGAVDQSSQEVRTFRLDRIRSKIHIQGNSEPFELPDGVGVDGEFGFEQFSNTAIIDVRKGKCQLLRSLSIASKDLGEWDQIKVPIFNEETLCRQILWHGEDAHVVQPDSLRQLLIAKLQSLVDLHG